MTERYKFLIQGFLLIILGFVFLINPALKIAIFTLVSGISLMFFGVLQIIDGLFKTQGIKYKLLRILEGLLFGGFGLIFLLKNPAIRLVLIIYTVIWIMILLSVMNSVVLIKYKKPMRWISIILNVLVIYFGITALLDPRLAITVFYWSVSFQLFFMGFNHISMFFILPKDDTKLE
ncbi:DUF308 domain-containing protein [Breznakia pachnodae]|uniref:Uncharacterized membrane protein HdeD (DUF308 family) n=1 Tax=Breznakia pachnodae TaxID=265178 RepID=A0ABU0E8S7_9FIRM|nr:DUF308 domain-containing protein [Breznakia pachnodae]MDQ0363295.1 uncharacterized membrane protein HdeD (DUF308 family) [Breznakia pachnodae]